MCTSHLCEDPFPLVQSALERLGEDYRYYAGSNTEVHCFEAEIQAVGYNTHSADSGGSDDVDGPEEHSSFAEKGVVAELGKQEHIRCPVDIVIGDTIEVGKQDLNH